ncbi:MAG: 50S ribosome-binding GTPase [Candidatus Nealsonbacteria bacterium]|nr:50S ribosome-binding GTPase [Candidatus Nealsonbacteria bacterium]
MEGVAGAKRSGAPEENGTPEENGAGAPLRSATSHPATSHPRANRLSLGRFSSATGEQIVVRCRSDRSVTLHCHGGEAAVARILDGLVRQGCRAVAWRDWARDTHEDPIAAAARIALAEARTGRTAAILLDQYQGALRRALDAIEQALTGNEIAAAKQQIETLLARADLGLHLCSPWRVVLAGRTNVGKSSLINALVGYDRAIVHHTTGTTRDVVTVRTAVDGWPIELSDTAGWNQSADPLERAGVELAQKRLGEADLAILVFDAAQPWTEADQALLHSAASPLVVHNKCDLPPARGERVAGLAVSALTGEGIGELVHGISNRLVPEPPPPGRAVPFTVEQAEYLEKSSKSA